MTAMEVMQELEAGPPGGSLNLGDVRQMLHRWQMHGRRAGVEREKPVEVEVVVTDKKQRAAK